MSEALEEYTAACIELLTFEREHSELLNQYGDLNVQVTAKEKWLKEVARDYGAEENELFAVTVQTKTRKWYDADKVLELAPYVAQMPGVMEVNRERINQLAKAKAIPAEVVAAAYREEALTPAVSIKRK